MSNVLTLAARAKNDLDAVCPVEWNWTVEGNRAVATQADPSLILNFIKIVDALHARGWKRTSKIGAGPYWDIDAYLRSGDDEVRVGGIAMLSDHPHGADAIFPFHADPPPRLSRSKAFLVKHKEWERKCREDEW